MNLTNVLAIVSPAVALLIYALTVRRQDAQKLESIVRIVDRHTAAEEEWQATMVTLVGDSKSDRHELWKSVKDHERRVSTLEGRLGQQVAGHEDRIKAVESKTKGD